MNCTQKMLNKSNYISFKIKITSREMWLVTVNGRYSDVLIRIIIGNDTNKMIGVQVGEVFVSVD